MADDSTGSVEIRSNGQSTTLSCIIEHPTKGKAVKKGLKVFGLTWLGAIATIAIPIVHWMTVPAGLLLGPVIGFLIYKTNLHRAHFHCPEATCLACQQPLPLVFASDVTDLERTCKNCGAALKIKLLTASSAASN